MSLLHGLVLDLGTYAAAMAVFAAITCYRANPDRAANRYLVVFFLTCGVWQLFVALARVTHDYVLWGTLCLPMGGILVVEMFLLHDACVAPRARLVERLRRNLLAWLGGLAAMLGVLLTPPNIVLPDIYPRSLRLLAAFAFVAAMVDVVRRQRAARVVNGHELMLFNLTACTLVLVCLIVFVVPAPLRSRINSVGTLVYLSIVLTMLLSGRVFDVAGTAKVALGYVVRFGVTLLLLLAVVQTFDSVVALHRLGMWLPALVVGLTIYPVAFVGNWITRRFFAPYRDRDLVAREAILQVLGVADSEPAIVQQIEHFASGYLAGLEVSVAVHESAPVVYGQDPRLGLALQVREAWLSPESALYSHRGPELDQLLDWFAAARLGAVVRYTGRKVSVFLFVGQRAGGKRPIATPELEFLHELSTIAGTSIDRLRAMDESVLGRRLAMIGRLAADFSHTARNQLSAIEALVEAVKEGRGAELSDEYRRAVYEETLALAANYDLALEINRLEPGKLQFRTIALSRFLQSVVSTYRPIAEKSGGQILLTEQSAGLTAAADEGTLRQVIVNLVRNALQACTSTGVRPIVEIRVRADGNSVYIDVVDTGPGVPVEVHDRLFTPWATTKSDGTGLGLSFCLEAMRAFGGDIKYLRPCGSEHAWFRLRFPATHLPIHSETPSCGSALQPAP